MADAIDYGPQQRGLAPAARRRLVVLFAVVAALIVGLFLVDWPAYQHNGWICSICGSRRSQNDWRFGWTTSASLQPTVLDAWIARHQGGHAHDWRHIVGTYTSVFGDHLGSAHGSAPAILWFANTGSPLIEEFVRTSTDEEIAAFVRVMTSGTEQEQRDALDATADRVLDAMR